VTAAVGGLGDPDPVAAPQLRFAKHVYRRGSDIKGTTGHG
jgi:hypothetical protein